MNLFIWILSGALIGWVAFEYLDLSHDRGRSASLVIGATGGVIGGMVLAPLLGVGTTAAGAVSGIALLIATCAAAALLVIGNYVYNIWRI